MSIQEKTSSDISNLIDSQTGTELLKNEFNLKTIEPEPGSIVDLLDSTLESLLEHNVDISEISWATEYVSSGEVSAIAVEHVRGVAKIMVDTEKSEIIGDSLEHCPEAEKAIE